MSVPRSAPEELRPESARAGPEARIVTPAEAPKASGKPLGADLDRLASQKWRRPHSLLPYGCIHHLASATAGTS